jgi:hypothetical protein
MIKISTLTISRKRILAVRHADGRLEVNRHAYEQISPMLITRRSPFTGRVQHCDIPITPAQLAQWKAGMTLAEAAPQLTPRERDFLQWGMTPGEAAAWWGEGLGEEEYYPAGEETL